MHAADAAAELEPQLGVVAQGLHDRDQVLAVDVERDLAAVHDDLGDRVRRRRPRPSTSCRAGRRPRRTSRRTGGAVAPGSATVPDQAAVAGGVAGAVDAEHAGDVDDVEVLLGSGPGRR